MEKTDVNATPYALIPPTLPPSRDFDVSAILEWISGMDQTILMDQAILGAFNPSGIQDVEVSGPHCQIRLTLRDAATLQAWVTSLSIREITTSTDGIIHVSRAHVALPDTWEIVLTSAEVKE